VGSEEKIFRDRPIRNKNCLWRPCLLMDRDEMSNLYRGPCIDASYQVSVHLTKRLQRRRFLEIGRKHLWKVFCKDCSLRPDPLTNMAIIDDSCFWLGPSIDDSYQVSVHLTKGFSEEKIKMWKVNEQQTTDDGRRTTDAKWWRKLTLSLARWDKKVYNYKTTKQTRGSGEPI
jgi:hypothetical protein